MPLAFDSDCLLIVDNDTIHVISRGKTTAVSAKNIGRLHQTLSQHICGKHDENEILDAAPAPRRPMVERYLQSMRDAGAFADTAKTAHAEIRLASAEQIGAALLRFDGSGPSRVFIEAALPSWADWLATLGAHIAEPGSIAVYREQEGGAGLDLEVCASRQPDSIATIPAQLDLIAPSPYRQLPLVSMTAGHRMYGLQLQRFGVSPEKVRTQLLREFIVAARVQPSQPIAVADSLLTLRLAALEMPPNADDARFVDCDLFEQPAAHPEIRYLISALRLRVAGLRGQTAVSEDGCFRYRHGEFERASMSREKALRDLLLDVAVRAFYPTVEINAQSPCDYHEFASAAEWEPLADSRGCDLIHSTVECWGASAHYGHLSPGSSL